jgi:ABC-type multidrug transport system ATPase subunit
MKIILENIGRRFNKEWIFKNINHTFLPNEPHVILGSNGSGKSTFLQLVSGYLMPSEGNIEFHQNVKIDTENFYKHISIASPSLELFEDLTLEETIHYHFQFKNLIGGIELNQLPEMFQLKGNEKKQLKNFSSGMKQRVKLGLAILSDTSVLLLDEPTSNMDKNGIGWYKELIKDHTKDRIILVASNKIEDDYFFCQHQLEMENFKP